MSAVSDCVTRGNSEKLVFGRGARLIVDSGQRQTKVIRNQNVSTKQKSLQMILHQRALSDFSDLHCSFKHLVRACCGSSVVGAASVSGFSSQTL